MRIDRHIDSFLEDPLLADKMLFLAGPKQSGKTNCALHWLNSTACDDLYFNWDDEHTRRSFRRDANFFESAARTHSRNPRIAFDEVHKIAGWKNVLKGYFDRFRSDFRFLVTGSARLELLHRAGDSMLGRYHLLHLPPLLVSEIEARVLNFANMILLTQETLSGQPVKDETITAMLKFGGFPEPFLKHSDRFLNLWHREYFQRLIREDLRDISRITDVNRAEHLIEILPHKIASPLSYNNLKNDLGCSYDAVKSIASAFEKLHITFTLRPYSRKVRNAITKEPKIYLVDWSSVPGEAARFENFLAMQLKACCEIISDSGAGELGLYYVRNKQGHEVDFALTLNGSPAALIEAKLSDDSPDRNLAYFSSTFGRIPCIQVVRKPGVFKKVSDRFWIVSASRFFGAIAQ